MTPVPAARIQGTGLPALVEGCVRQHGSRAHRYFAGGILRSGSEIGRNLADACFFLSTLHARQPSLISLAIGRTEDPAARRWLDEADQAMTVERLYLARLAVAAGPVPSTPGGTRSEAAVNGQRSALATLAQSDRRGCALGAAVGLALDWLEIRTLLDSAANRFGVDIPACRLMAEGVLASVEAVIGDLATERAILFGAEQIALQHRGLWDLLEARYLARR